MHRQKIRFLMTAMALLAFISGCAAQRGMRGDATLREADSKLRQKNYEAVIPLLEPYVVKHPGNVPAKNGLGLSYMETGRYDEAIAQLNDALNIRPDDAEAILYLGMSYLRKEQFGKAIETWQRYRSDKYPEIEKEIKRNLTLLLISENQKAAKRAMEMEKQLLGVTPDPNAVAVSYFEDMSPDKSMQAFQKGLAAMVITTLSKIKSLKVVERLRLQALLNEMALGQAGVVDPDTAPKVGRLVGASKFVTGNLALGSIDVRTSMVDAVSGEVMGDKHVRVEQERFFEVPGMVALGVAEIGGFELTDAERKAIGVPLTTNTDAAIAFGQALIAFDAGQWEAASNFFNEAVRIDPQFGEAITALSTVPPPQAPTVQQIRQMGDQQLSQTVADPIATAIEQTEQVETIVRLIEEGPVSAPQEETAETETEPAAEVTPEEEQSAVVMQEMTIIETEERFADNQEIIVEQQVEEQTTSEAPMPDFPGAPE